MVKKKKIATTYDNEKPIFKVLVAGDKNVGKTTLIRRYVDDLFTENTKATIGVDFSLKNMLSDKISYILQIWDIGGEDRFRAILPNYMMGTHIVILAFDSTNPEFEKLIDWVTVISKTLKECIIFLISTKNDIIKFENQDEIDKLMLNYPEIVKYYETSSKFKLNVDELFNEVGNLLLKRFNFI